MGLWGVSYLAGWPPNAQSGGSGKLGGQVGRFGDRPLADKVLAHIGGGPALERRAVGQQRHLALGGRVVRPGAVVTGRVQVDGPTILDVTEHAHTGDDIIVPGFIDLHCHGGGGHTFTQGDPAAARAAAAFHLAHGTTTMLASLVSSPFSLMQAATAAYAPLVTPGQYLIVQDTMADYGPDPLTDYAGPWRAVQDFLATEGDAWEVDETRERMVLTCAPGGFLRRR